MVVIQIMKRSKENTEHQKQMHFTLHIEVILQNFDILLGDIFPHCGYSKMLFLQTSNPFLSILDEKVGGKEGRAGL